MYKIGEFSSLTEIPIKTLRYYDEIDVLKPNYVDRYSGYRLYDDDNLEDCKFVKTAKALGCTLENIHDHVAQNGHEMTENFLDRCEDRIRQNIEYSHAQLNYISENRKKLKILSPQKILVTPWMKKIKV